MQTCLRQNGYRIVMIITVVMMLLSMTIGGEPDRTGPNAPPPPLLFETGAARTKNNASVMRFRKTPEHRSKNNVDGGVDGDGDDDDRP
eukprot:7909830-Lingulodinium_polyedra.AAC.1